MCILAHGPPLLPLDPIGQDLYRLPGKKPNKETLDVAKLGRIADTEVVPLRRQIEMFRFSTVRLDVRENSTRVTQTLEALWRASRGEPEDVPAPAQDSAEWRDWLLAELAAPRAGVRDTSGLPAVAAETLGLFRLIADMRPPGR